LKYQTQFYRIKSRGNIPEILKYGVRLSRSPGEFAGVSLK
jgi:hypothetical protein